MTASQLGRWNTQAPFGALRTQPSATATAAALAATVATMLHHCLVPVVAATEASSDLLAKASTVLIISAVIAGVLVLMCCAHYCFKHGLLTTLDHRIIGHGHTRHDFDKFRRAHAEHVEPPVHRHGAGALTLGCFNEPDHLPYRAEDREGSFRIDYDPETHQHVVLLNEKRTGKWPVTVQTDYPLAGPTAELDRDVYYEVEVLHMAHDTTLSIGWATFVYPPFVLPGQEPHSVSIVSQAANSREALLDAKHRGTHPALLFNACAADGVVDRAALRREPLQAGDVVGVGYRQIRRAAAAGAGAAPGVSAKRIQIQFFFTINGKEVELAGLATMPAVNRTWDAREAETAAADPSHAPLGILANGCAHPSIGARGRASLAVRLVGPFQFAQTHTVAHAQSRAVSRRHSVHVAGIGSSEEFAPRFAPVMSRLERHEHNADIRRALGRRSSLPTTKHRPARVTTDSVSYSLGRDDGASGRPKRHSIDDVAHKAHVEIRMHSGRVQQDGTVALSEGASLTDADELDGDGGGAHGAGGDGGGAGSRGSHGDDDDDGESLGLDGAYERRIGFYARRRDDEIAAAMERRQRRHSHPLPHPNHADNARATRAFGGPAAVATDHDIVHEQGRRHFLESGRHKSGAIRNGASESKARPYRSSSGGSGSGDGGVGHHGERRHGPGHSSRHHSGGRGHSHGDADAGARVGGGGGGGASSWGGAAASAGAGR